MQFRILIAVALTGCSLAAQSRGPAELANAPVPPGARRIVYGSNPMHFGELRLPSTKGPHPVAIVVHGGCWVSQLGTYDPRAVALDNMRPMANALTEAGIATWNIEYRRIDQPGGGWPGTFLDVAAAADFLRTIAAPEQLDLNRAIAIGHSAGGHLAMWLAARGRIPAGSDLYTKSPLPLAGAVNLDGPADLAAALSVEKQICGRPVITELMGGTPAERADRYRAASPAELLPYGGRQVFLAGAMFGSQVVPYTEAAKKAGETIATATNFVKAGHFLFIDPQSEIWPEVVRSVQRTLSKPQ
jgi:acetyl esterase/lipase